MQYWHKNKVVDAHNIAVCGGGARAHIILDECQNLDYLKGIYSSNDYFRGIYSSNVGREKRPMVYRKLFAISLQSTCEEAIYLTPTPNGHVDRMLEILVLKLRSNTDRRYIQFAQP